MEVALLGGHVVVVEPSLGERGLGLERHGLRGLGGRRSSVQARPASGGVGKCTRDRLDRNRSFLPNGDLVDSLCVG